MRRLILNGAALAFAGLGAAIANDDVVGSWQGELVINPTTSIVVQFIIEKGEDGSYSAMLNAPEEARLRNIPVSAFEYDQGQVKMDVLRVSGVYEGAVTDGEIKGTWSQQGVSFPLDLEPFEVPELSAETMQTLLGSWFGELKVPNLADPLTLNFRFEFNSAGDLVAFLDSPDQGAFGIEVDEFSMVDDRIAIKIANPKMEYVATLNGERMVGEFVQRDVMPLVLQKGQYEQRELAVTPELKRKLIGSWNGQLQNTSTIVLRFYEMDDGKFAGSFDSLDEGRGDIPVTVAELVGDRLTLKLGIGGTIEGKFSGTEIVGTFDLRGQSRALALAKGEYLAHQLRLPAETVEQLLGRWEAKTANTTFLFRFEEREQGGALAFVDIPSEGLRGLPITEVAVEGADMGFLVRGMGAEFKGTLESNQISGEWTMPDLQFPLVMNKVLR